MSSTTSKKITVQVPITITVAWEVSEENIDFSFTDEQTAKQLWKLASEMAEKDPSGILELEDESGDIEADIYDSVNGGYYEDALVTLLQWKLENLNERLDELKQELSPKMALSSLKFSALSKAMCNKMNKLTEITTETLKLPPSPIDSDDE